MGVGAFVLVKSAHTKNGTRAFWVRTVPTSGMVSLVGLRRPFSPQAERPFEGIMTKKSKSVSDQPIGIVIATGQTSQSNPRVRAYYWCDVEPSDSSRLEDESLFVK